MLGRSPEGATAAGGIAALSDGLLHYYLGGTAEAHLGDSPFKNVVEAMIELAAELGVTLNLGGGRPARRRPGGLQARLRQSASSPSTRTRSSATPTLIERLSEGRADSGFFPLYRAPAS